MTSYSFNYPARVLAALIDLMMLRILAGVFLSSNYWGAGTFLLAGLYFSIGNSQYLSGATPGKKLFGLFVVNSKDQSLLSLSKSFKRYLLFPGIIILLVEVPPIFFRANATVANPFFLELNMLFALALSFMAFFVFLAGGDQKGIHDWFAGSTVLRLNDPKQEISPLADTKKWTSRHFIAVSLASFTAFLLWLIGLAGPEPVKNIASHKYLMEQNRPIRIAGAQVIGSTLELGLYFLEESKEETISQQLNEILSLMLSYNLIDDARAVTAVVKTSDGKNMTFHRKPQETSLNREVSEQS